jgi:Lrp/AsnC family transcriptional regulator, leucine-responsive regulatory protein
LASDIFIPQQHGNGLRVGDRKILRILQEVSTIQNQDLVAKVGLSASPCLRRVKALEAPG